MFIIVFLRDSEIGSNLEFKSVESILYRQRSQYIPKIPKTMDELVDSIQYYQPAAQIYKGSVVGADGSIGILLSTTTLMKAFAESSTVHYDGTFAVNISYQFKSEKYLI